MKTNKKKFNVAVDLTVQIIKEGNVYVAYCPALDFTTQSDTFEGAQKMFAEGVDIFIEELMEMGTLEKVLLDLGWKKSTKKKSWDPPERSLIQETHQEVKIPCHT